MTNLALITAYTFDDLSDGAQSFVRTYLAEDDIPTSAAAFNAEGEYIDDDIIHCFGPRITSRLLRTAPQLRSASQRLYDAIQGYLVNVPDAELPEDLVAAFDGMEEAWRNGD